MLSNRIEECRERIGKMCAEQRPPKMRIPVTADDDDMFIDNVLKECAAILAGIPHPERVRAVLLAAQALLDVWSFEDDALFVIPIGLVDELRIAHAEMGRIES